MCLAALLEGLFTSEVLSGVVSGGVSILLFSSGGFWGGYVFSQTTGEISGGSVGSLSRRGIRLQPTGVKCRSTVIPLSSTFLG